MGSVSLLFGLVEDLGASCFADALFICWSADIIHHHLRFRHEGFLPPETARYGMGYGSLEISTSREERALHKKSLCLCLIAELNRVNCQYLSQHLFHSK